MERVLPTPTQQLRGGVSVVPSRRRPSSSTSWVHPRPISARATTTIFFSFMAVAATAAVTFLSSPAATAFPVRHLHRQLRLSPAGSSSVCDPGRSRFVAWRLCSDRTSSTSSVSSSSSSFNTETPPLQQEQQPSTMSPPTATTESTRQSLKEEEYPYNLPPVAPTAKRIFWIRHGEVINPGGKNRSVYYGAQDVPLSEHGQNEAIAAAEYFVAANMAPLAAVFSSTLSRAIYGAEQVCCYQNENNKNINHAPLSVQSLEGYRELDRGAWCGLTLEEIGRETMARFDACDESVTPSNGGESYPTLMRRVLQARDEQTLPCVPLGQAAAVVSHLQVTRCVLSEALDIPIQQMAAHLKIATASITCIDYDYATTGTAMATASSNTRTDSLDVKHDSGDETAIVQQKPTSFVHFQSFKPNVGLPKSKDGAN